MPKSRFWTSAFVCAAFLLLFRSNLALAQSSQRGTWATDTDADAKLMIEVERKWAVDDCVPTNVVDEYVADDFVGTSPAGPTYTKADMLKEHSAPGAARDCKLLSAKVRYFGPTVAVIYGSETAIHKGPDGKELTITLIWTDTWMKRNGKWQIIAVQDMVDPRK